MARPQIFTGKWNVLESRRRVEDGIPGSRGDDNRGRFVGARDGQQGTYEVMDYVVGCRLSDQIIGDFPCADEGREGTPRSLAQCASPSTATSGRCVRERRESGVPACSRPGNALEANTRLTT